MPPSRQASKEKTRLSVDKPSTSRRNSLNVPNEKSTAGRRNSISPNNDKQNANRRNSQTRGKSRGAKKEGSTSKKNPEAAAPKIKEPATPASNQGSRQELETVGIGQEGDGVTPGISRRGSTAPDAANGDTKNILEERPESVQSALMRAEELSEIDARMEQHRSNRVTQRTKADMWKQTLEEKRAKILEKYANLKEMRSKKIDDFLEKSGLRRLFALGKERDMAEAEANTDNADGTAVPLRTQEEIIKEQEEEEQARKEKPATRGSSRESRGKSRKREKRAASDRRKSTTGEGDQKKSISGDPMQPTKTPRIVPSPDGN